MKSYQVNEKGYYGEFGGAENSAERISPKSCTGVLANFRRHTQKFLTTKGSRKSTRSYLKTTWDALPHSISPIACPRNTDARSI